MPNIHVDGYIFGEDIGVTLGSVRRGGQDLRARSLGRAGAVVSWVFRPPIGSAYLSAYVHTCTHIIRCVGYTGRGVKLCGHLT